MDILCCFFAFGFRNLDREPKTESNRAQNTATKLRDVLFFLGVLKMFYGLFGIIGVLIIPKWLIKVPGHIPLLLTTFWNFRNVHQTWTFPFLFYVEMLQTIQEK